MLIHTPIYYFITYKYSSLSLASSIINPPAHPPSSLPLSYLCWLVVWSAIIHFYFHFFLYLSPPFFLAIASLTASVHTSSGPVPTQTQFPWQQIHPELQVTNHTSVCFCLYKLSSRGSKLKSVFIYLCVNWAKND